jgi:hypothetical protein
MQICISRKDRRLIAAIFMRNSVYFFKNDAAFISSIDVHAAIHMQGSAGNIVSPR